MRRDPAWCQAHSWGWMCSACVTVKSEGPKSTECQWEAWRNSCLGLKGSEGAADGTCGPLVMGLPEPGGQGGVSVQAAPGRMGVGGHSGHARQGQTEPPCALQGPAEGVGGREDLRLPESTLNSQSGWCFCSSGRGWADGGNTGQDPWVQACGISPGEGSGLPVGGLVLLEGSSSCFLCFPGLSPGPSRALS